VVHCTIHGQQFEKHAMVCLSGNFTLSASKFNDSWLCSWQCRVQCRVLMHSGGCCYRSSQCHNGTDYTMEQQLWITLGCFITQHVIDTGCAERVLPGTSQQCWMCEATVMLRQSRQQ
jgi:hypothetical protein